MKISHITNNFWILKSNLNLYNIMHKILHVNKQVEKKRMILTLQIDVQIF